MSPNFHGNDVRSPGAGRGRPVDLAARLLDRHRATQHASTRTRDAPNYTRRVRTQSRRILRRVGYQFQYTPG